MAIFAPTPASSSITYFILQVIIRFRDIDNNARLKRVCDYFKLSGKKVADNYLQRLLRAEQLFYYHPVYNPHTDSIAHFTDPTADFSSLGSSVCPEITPAELMKLGGDPSEILTLTRKDGSDARHSHTAASGLAIHDVCRGHYSIKDHNEILPRYPWERLQQGRMVVTEASGRCTGWYMRRTLMSSLNQSGSHSLYASSASMSISGGAGKVEMNTGRSLISTFMLPRTAPRPAAAANAPDAAGASRAVAVTSSYFSSNSSARSSHFAPSAEKARSPPSVRPAAHRFSAFGLLAAPSGTNTTRIETQSFASASRTITDEVVVMEEVGQSVYDLQEEDGADVLEEDSAAEYADHTTSEESDRSQSQRLGALGRDSDAECLAFADRVDAAPTVYDVMDSPLVARRPVGTSLRAHEDTAAGGMLVDLCAESPIAASSLIVTPTLARVGQNPFKATPPVQPTATVKKSRPQAASSVENSTGSIHHASAQVHRKTLGAASFVPIQPPPLDESITAARRASTGPVSNESGAKRKAGGTFAPVQVPRKKLPNVQSSGSIMVASIKSFFSAV
jgi:hypothetical protein